MIRIIKFVILHCGNGEIGRRTILRGWRPQGMGVQVPLPAQKRRALFLFFYLYIVGKAWISSRHFMSDLNKSLFLNEERKGKPKSPVCAEA